MDITNPKNVEISLLDSILNEKGIFKIDSFLDVNEIKKLKKEVLNYHKKYGKDYPFGSNYAILNPEKLPDNNIQKKVFLKPWIKKLFISYNKGISKGFFSSIYSTHDYKFDGSIGRNGHLHFDRNASLKFFLYLNDVNEENGAFFIQPNSHLLGKELRKKAWGKLVPTPNDGLFKKTSVKFFGKPFKDIKNRIAIDYPELYQPEKLIPVEGKAGTLIVFDSDIFHQGGKVKKSDLERIVLRLHCYLS